MLPVIFDDTACSPPFLSRTPVYIACKLRKVPTTAVISKRCSYDHYFLTFANLRYLPCEPFRLQLFEAKAMDFKAALDILAERP